MFEMLFLASIALIVLSQLLPDEEDDKKNRQTITPAIDNVRDRKQHLHKNKQPCRFTSDRAVNNSASNQLSLSL